MFGKHKGYSVFVPLPHTENGYRCKTEHRPLPHRDLQVRTKKSGVYSGAGEWYNKVKCTNTHHVKNVAESLLANRLLFARKLVLNLISKLSIERATEPSLTNTMRAIEKNTPILLQHNVSVRLSAKKQPPECLAYHATAVARTRTYICTM